jgi:hypothetical protein
MARVYKNIISLEKAIIKKEEALRVERNKKTSQFGNIGFGHSMRCTKINISFSREDKLRDDLRDLYIQKDILTK